MEQLLLQLGYSNPPQLLMVQWAENVAEPVTTATDFDQQDWTVCSSDYGREIMSRYTDLYTDLSEGKAVAQTRAEEYLHENRIWFLTIGGNHQRVATQVRTVHRLSVNNSFPDVSPSSAFWHITLRVGRLTNFPFSPFILLKSTSTFLKTKRWWLVSPTTRSFLPTLIK